MAAKLYHQCFFGNTVKRVWGYKIHRMITVVLEMTQHLNTFYTEKIVFLRSKFYFHTSFVKLKIGI